MNETFIDENYLVIPTNRCIYCNGVEVINIDTGESNMKNNLVEGIRYFACKNQEECEANLTNDYATNYNILISEDEISLTDINGDFISIKNSRWNK